MQVSILCDDVRAMSHVICLPHVSIEQLKVSKF